MSDATSGALQAAGVPAFGPTAGRALAVLRRHASPSLAHHAVRSCAWAFARATISSASR